MPVLGFVETVVRNNLSIKLPDYQSVREALSHACAVVSPSEAHGLLCGLLTVGKVQEIDGALWVKSITSGLDGDPQLVPEKVKMLSTLFDLTKQMFSELEFDFSMLVPDDDVPLNIRAEELGQWCQGYLSGLGLGDINLDSIRSDEIKDILHKIHEISQIDYEGLTISEDDETAFIEVSEFIRIAVMSLHLEVLQYKRKNSDSDMNGRCH